MSAARVLEVWVGGARPPRRVRRVVWHHRRQLQWLRHPRRALVRPRSPRARARPCQTKPLMGVLQLMHADLQAPPGASDGGRMGVDRDGRVSLDEMTGGVATHFARKLYATSHAAVQEQSKRLDAALSKAPDASRRAGKACCLRLRGRQRHQQHHQSRQQAACGCSACARHAHAQRGARRAQPRRPAGR